nr:uncharacterized protein LOC115493085 [Taeniopygia guttata]
MSPMSPHRGPVGDMGRTLGTPPGPLGGRGGGDVTSPCPHPAAPLPACSPSVPRACPPSPPASPGVSPQCPRGVPGVSPAAMEPRELLEALVAVVAVLGEVAATVAGPYGDVLLAVSPRSLHTALGTFINHLRDTLGHQAVPSLGQALAALGATPGATWVHVTRAASAWQDPVAALRDGWDQLAGEAIELRDACRDTATREATTAATATTLAGDLQVKATQWGTARDNLVAAARPVLLALDKEEATSALAAHEAQMAAATNKVVAATKATEQTGVPTSEARAASRREQRAEVALELLERLVAVCDKATTFPRELQRRLGDIEATLKGTNEMSPDVPAALVAAATEAERLWEASACLATRHLLRTLGDIRTLLSSCHGGPGGRAVAEQCQRAIEDIPRLL